MHKVSWAALGAQAVNILALIASVSTPHTAAIIGGALTIAQAVLPSIFPHVNAASAAQ